MANENDSRSGGQQEDRRSELQKIAHDAVVHVLERPDGRRGPYVINDATLKRNDEGPAVLCA